MVSKGILTVSGVPIAAFDHSTARESAHHFVETNVHASPPEAEAGMPRPPLPAARGERRRPLLLTVLLVHRLGERAGLDAPLLLQLDDRSSRCHSVVTSEMNFIISSSSSLTPIPQGASSIVSTGLSYSDRKSVG